jgi:hypothetical protein
VFAEAAGRLASNFRLMRFAVTRHRPAGASFRSEHASRSCVLFVWTDRMDYAAYAVFSNPSPAAYERSTSSCETIPLRRRTNFSSVPRSKGEFTP